MIWCKCHECGHVDNCVFAYSTASGGCKRFQTPEELEVERKVSTAYFRGFVLGIGFVVVAYVVAFQVLKYMGYAS